MSDRAAAPRSWGFGGVAAAIALAAAPAIAQEASPPSDAPRALPAIRDWSWSEAQLVSHADADRALLFVRDFWIQLDGDTELRADVALLWGDRELLLLRDLDRSATASSPLRFGPQVPPTPGRSPLPQPGSGSALGMAVNGLHELYAAGHVYFRQGDESLFATELYQHLLERRGIVVDADAFHRTRYGGEGEVRPGEAPREADLDVHVRAARLRSLGLGAIVAEQAQFSTCVYGHPHWHVESGTITATLRDPAAPAAPGLERLALADNWLELEDAPLLPLPGFTTDFAQGDSLPLRKVRAGHSTRFGAFLQTLWGRELPELAHALEESLGLDDPLTLGLELDVDAYARRGGALGPALDWRVPGLVSGELGGYWIHDQQDEDSEIPAPIDHPDRGRAYLRNRFTPLEYWRLDTEVQWYSDAGFQPEYFEREFKEEKDPESYVHLIRQEDTARWRLLYRKRLNDFQSQVDNLPRGGFDMVAEPLFDLRLPSWLRHGGQPAHLLLTQAHDVANYRIHPADDSLLDSERVVRADSLLDLSTTVSLGPVALRPFTSGRFTGWDRSIDDSGALGRGVFLSGAHAELMVHRDFDAWLPALQVDGLRHIARFDIDWMNLWESSRDPAELVQVDQVDTLTEREVVLLAVRQRFQTHRADFDELTLRREPVIEDMFELDLELPLYPEAARDNQGPEAGSTAGHSAGPLRYDTLWRPGFTGRVLRRSFLFSEGEWSFNDGAFDTVNVGAGLQPTLDWTTRVSWRNTRGISEVLTAEIDWRLVNKWSVAVLEQYDLDQNDGLEHRIELRRHGHDFTLAFGFERDQGDGDTAFTFALYPSFLSRGRAERSQASGRGDRPSLSGDH
ncbi:MAG: hypothetical protein FJ293_06985 [Planctomycetes bacterium]|nr:hypothetical protein [Planctomycetota bacterium]